MKIIMRNVVTLVFLTSVCFCEKPQIELKLGTVRGFSEIIFNKSVNVFLGIPYAEPPLNNLRFAKPQPLLKHWNKLEANQWPSTCMQPKEPFEIYLSEANEDCLYLNIWAPNDALENQKAVMFYIHGGGLMFGSSSYKHLNASVLASVGDVIVVTFNYRLGSFGFLFGNNDEVAGNMGLYDQLLALKWVDENIKHFGGNKDMISIFGGSGGGWSVTFHLLSPLSQPLFKNAISMSGVGVEHLNIFEKERAFKHTISLAEAVNCTFNDERSLSKSTIDCLRQTDANKIIEVQQRFSLSGVGQSPYGLVFAPIVDGEFIPRKISTLLRENRFKQNSSLLIGTVSVEGNLLDSIPALASLDATYSENLQRLFTVYNPPEVSIDIDDIMKIYFPTNNCSLTQYYNVFGDAYFDCPSIIFGEQYFKSNRVFRYVFNYESINTNDRVIPCIVRGTCHANDVPFTFGTVSDAKDLNASLAWIKIIADFAKSESVQWPSYYRSKQGDVIPFYYTFNGNVTSSKLDIGYKSCICKFWKSILLKTTK